MLRRLAAVVPFAFAAVPAQEPPQPVFAPCQLDSGNVDGPAGGAAVATVGDVHVANASSLQLWFGTCVLRAGTQLRLTGTRDGAVQWFDARSLGEYGRVSAFFNGDRVHVDLLPAAGTFGNRVVVSKLRLGGPVSVPESLCGAADMRLPSSDPRVGRLDGCCTVFLVDERNVCTAGHCIGAIGGQLVNFNVPLSDAGGNTQYPPPQDQYALRAGSLTAVNGGPGNDFAVMSTVRNSNTGLYPGEAQGSWLVPALVPPGSMSQIWTVTGYGTTSVNPTWSLAQKSSSGPRSTTNNVLLQFRIDVSGCNSGSPVIGTNGTDVHGVVTHAGCTATGGSNYGTGLGLVAFQQALQGLQQNFVAGTFGTFGQGCAGGAGVPQLLLSGTPDLGGAVTSTVTGTDPGSDNFGLLLLGLSDVAWNGVPLPADLAAVGLPGCALLVAPELTFSLSTNFGSASLLLPIPNQLPFLAATFDTQFFAYDPTAANAAVASNGARMHIGN